MGSKALALYEQARAATTAAERRELLDTFAQAQRQLDASRRSSPRQPNSARGLRRRVRSRANRPKASPISSPLAAPVALPAEAPRRCSPRRPSAGPRRQPLKAAHRRAPSRRWKRHADDGRARRPPRCSKLLDDPGDDRRGAADRREVGQGRALKARPKSRARRCSRELGDATASDERRAEAAASLLVVAVARAGDAARNRSRCWPTPAAPAPLKTRLDRGARRESRPRRGRRADRRARRNATRRRSSIRSCGVPNRRLRAARRAERRHESRRRNSGPGNVARLRTHPNRQVARAGGDAARFG